MKTLDIKQPSKDCLTLNKGFDLNDCLKSKNNSISKAILNVMNSQEHEENDSIPPYDDPLY